MGFDSIGDMVSWYNAPYYAKHFESLQYEKANEWLEYYFNVDLKPERTSQYTKMAEVIKKRYHLRVIDFKKTKEVLPYVDKIFDLFDQTYSKLVSYVPLSKKQIDYFKSKYINFIDPEFIKYIEDLEGNPVAFAITMRSYSEALIKAKGRLFPFGFLHLLFAKKKSKEVLFYLIGVHPEYQKKGVVAIIFDEFAKSYIKHGIKRAFRTPELETNTDIIALWKEFNPINHKRRKTFRKTIS
jgi:ribosomal protein S18 acetylase RimI-like enzyme